MESLVGIPQATAAAIAKRLSHESTLRLPAQLRGAPTRASDGSEGALGEASDAAKQGYLEALLLRDPGVFLERHGELLTAAERAAFEPLR